jgi:hypothetical protein
MLINDGTMISIDPIWITTDDYEYARKYYFFAYFIKKSLDYMEYVDENICKLYFDDINKIVHATYYDYMKIDKNKPSIDLYKKFINETKINHSFELYEYYISNLLSDKTHFGHIGYQNWVNNFLSKIKNKKKFFKKNIYVLSDSTIDYSPDCVSDDNIKNIIVQHRIKYFENILKNEYFASNVHIDAIGGTGYVNSGDCIEELIDDLDYFMKNSDTNILTIIDKITYKKQISMFEFNLVYDNFKKHIDPNKYHNLFIYRLENIKHKIDYLIVLGYGNDIPYLNDIDNKYGLNFMMIQFMVNLFWLYAKIYVMS